LVPFIAILFILGYILIWGFGMAYLISSANIEQPERSATKYQSQFKSIDFVGKEHIKW